MRTDDNSSQQRRLDPNADITNDPQAQDALRQSLRNDILAGSTHMYHQGWERTGNEFWGSLKGIIDSLFNWADLICTRIAHGEEAFYNRAEEEYNYNLRGPDPRYDADPDDNTADQSSSLNIPNKDTKLSGADFDRTSKNFGLAFSTAADPDATLQVAKELTKELDGQTLSQPNITV